MMYDYCCASYMHDLHVVEVSVCISIIRNSKYSYRYCMYRTLCTCKYSTRRGTFYFARPSYFGVCLPVDILSYSSMRG
jgi:hypothetical protein